MDPQLLALANTAGTTIVALLATDAWGRARAAVGALWRRAHPDRAAAVEAELDDTRIEVIAARDAGDQAVEKALIGEWQGRLRRLLAADSSIAEQLRQILDDDLGPALTATTGQTWTGTVQMTGTASGRGRVYQIGQGAQYITER